MGCLHALLTVFSACRSAHVSHSQLAAYSLRLRRCNARVSSWYCRSAATAGARAARCSSRLRRARAHIDAHTHIHTHTYSHMCIYTHGHTHSQRSYRAQRRAHITVSAVAHGARTGRAACAYLRCCSSSCAAVLQTESSCLSSPVIWSARSAVPRSSSRWDTRPTGSEHAPTACRACVTT